MANPDIAFHLPPPVPPHISRSSRTTRPPTHQLQHPSSSSMQEHLELHGQRDPQQGELPPPPFQVKPQIASTILESSTPLSERPNLFQSALEAGLIVEPEEDETTVSDVPTVQHFNVSFAFRKTFREHEGATATKHIRTFLYYLYSYTMKITYNVLLIMFGVFMAFLWALVNGIIAFIQTWFISPWVRITLVIVQVILPAVLEPLKTIMSAVFEAMPMCRR